MQMGPAVVLPVVTLRTSKVRKMTSNILTDIHMPFNLMLLGQNKSEFFLILLGNRTVILWLFEVQPKLLLYDAADTPMH